MMQEKYMQDFIPEFDSAPAPALIITEGFVKPLRDSTGADVLPKSDVTINDIPSMAEIMEKGTGESEPPVKQEPEQPDNNSNQPNANKTAVSASLVALVVCLATVLIVLVKFRQTR